MYGQRVCNLDKMIIEGRNHPKSGDYKDQHLHNTVKEGKANILALALMVLEKKMLYK